MRINDLGRCVVYSLVLTAVPVLAGCQTAKGTGTLAGAGGGALIGQAAGGNTGSAMVGGAVGGGAGVIIGGQVQAREAEGPPKAAGAGGGPR